MNHCCLHCVSNLVVKTWASFPNKVDENTIKEVRNHFRLKKERDEHAIKDERNLRKLKKKMKQSERK